MDELFEIKNYYYLGNYQAVVNEVNKRSKQLRAKQDAECYMYRAMIALGDCDMVLREIRESEANPSLQAVRLLASYTQSPNANAETAVATVKKWLTDGVDYNNPIVQLVASTIFYNESNYEDTLRILNKTDNLECMSLLVQTYLKIDRLDLAEKQYAQMKSIDVDATPSLIASTWIAITQGDEQVKVALSVFEELSEKYGPTSLLLNGRATCEILLRRFEKAENLLLLSLEKNSKDPDTIANLIACYIHMKKPVEVTNRYLSQLKSTSPKHHWLESQLHAEQSFDRSKTRFEIVLNCLGSIYRTIAFSCLGVVTLRIGKQIWRL
ncbi:coatomer protein complex epsilon subunit [Heterostelium album PN500]|uniref:Coatomer subunit epsilon n=1 Tax=Heterostelium pallidum (strain ATCC 26659 / Pp 5 / PN500) TaxID=670386 RepID=D3B4H4_HETP5|nr:coatomer protein complex epsilon subunit [Heterostelium album PN500]EFA84222.1 coatomer protein complex epsilon subunit [Heterostelium album PN500]|eukprot:XP_020436338.1 coatomer protein complex epsilon subunit [Heterostelium album PN500]